MKIVMNGSAMSPHRLVFDEDRAISCTKPPGTLSTPFGTVSIQFVLIVRKHVVEANFAGCFSMYLFKGPPDIPPMVEAMLAFINPYLR